MENDEVTIKEVDISGTSVTHLPKKFVFSSKLENLEVDGCPLVFPPIEVCSQGIDFIREYFHELNAVGGVRRGRIKILVMGITMAGKTSFVEALESGKPFLAEPDERTIGVVETVMNLDYKIECKLIDSGGHRAYMLTNQLFISDNSLVLIVVDSNQYKFTQQCFRQNIADFLQVVYDRNSRAHIAIVVSKVDLMVDMSRDEMSRKWSKHLDTCLRQFLKIRQAEIDRTKRIIAAGDFPNKYISERLHFFDFQRITVEKNVLLTSAATHEGVVSVKNHLRELCGNERLLPSLHTELPLSWVTVEDKLITSKPQKSVPITDVSYAMQLCVEHGLTEESCRELLNYLNQVGSILYYSHHLTLAEVLFPVPPFVVTLLKAVFRHDHESLEYDYRFIGADVGPQKFKEMKKDLVFNGIARISMLLALWNEFHLTADRHVDVFIKLFLALDFGYLTGSSDDVVQELAHALGRHQITLTPPSCTNPTSDSSGHTIEQNRLQEQTDSCKEMISKLKQHNVGLLLPWLLNDEKPEDVSKLWPLDIPHGVMQVAVEYSFAYDCPLGLFERLSARCHRHANFFRHWSSGLLMRYGAW
ncbi:malignant fibrous histiocytoma-amplified sequence 1 homolog [Corticium candelabrum]|uniref:malignant fibrous histiocytoma-amplified sequence 1 homolog n=1 Tax=Corticium candelabrum TaxID=121492 RepID=UPI002E26A3B7|nr:malignant fibrous histiocytoma-amplified sequence 1 homolog [Corticium candelabrum]